MKIEYVKHSVETIVSDILVVIYAGLFAVLNPYISRDIWVGCGFIIVLVVLVGMKYIKIVID